MTDEEIEEYETEFAGHTITGLYEEINQLRIEIEGSKTEWHDLRKNPDDLPTVTNSQFLWMCWINPYGNKCYHQGYYDDKGFYWIDDRFCTKHYPVTDIIAWCELPKFEE